jgi:hypothetical protein
VAGGVLEEVELDPPRSGGVVDGSELAVGAGAAVLVPTGSAVVALDSGALVSWLVCPEGGDGSLGGGPVVVVDGSGGGTISTAGSGCPVIAASSSG